MKKLLVVSGLTVLGLVLALNARALPGLGNVSGTKAERVVTKGVEEGGKMAVLDKANKDLAVKAANCKCNVDAGTVSGCDYSGIASVVNNNRQALQTFFNRDAQLYVTSASQGCATEVQSNTTGWWYWHTARDSSLGSKIVLKFK